MTTSMLFAGSTAGDNVSLTISGLTASSILDVYVYAGLSGEPSATFDVNGNFIKRRNMAAFDIAGSLIKLPSKGLHYE